VLELNVIDVIALIARSLKGSSQDDPGDTKLRQEAMKCFQVSQATRSYHVSALICISLGSCILIALLLIQGSLWIH
jgi:hypothetical protein